MNIQDAPHSRSSVIQGVAGVWAKISRTLRRGWSGGTERCLLCAAPRSKTVGALPLCAACYGEIPWIRRIACTTCGRYELCGDCQRRKETSFAFSRSAVEYSPEMKQWLARWKYRGDERLLAIFAEMLFQAYGNVARELQLSGGAIDVITYVPLSPQRLEDRGFNQAERLARSLSDHFHIPLWPLLLRTRHTEKQSLKTRAERLRDLKNVFAVDSEAIRQLHSISQGQPVRIMLVDDVYTTGSTLNQCAKALVTSLDATVYGLTWAR